MKHDLTDPGRSMLDEAVEAGWMTAEHAASVDKWASELAVQMAEGRLTEDQVETAVLQRLAADLAKRGRA